MLRSGGMGGRGPAGERGPKGDAGSQGQVGATGSQGASGPAGPKGDTGLQGPKGDTGITGPAGAASTVAGPKGDTGATGATGAKGDAGSPANTLIGTVTLAQTATIALTLGIREVTVALTGAVVGERYQAFARSYRLNGGASAAGRPPGYTVLDAACNTAGQITVSLNAPALALNASYAITADIVRVNT